MTSVFITRHGQARLSQRGIRQTDLDLVLAHGTEIGCDRIMLMARDAAKLIRARKQEIAKIERLTGKVLVVSNGHLVTAYHQTTPSRPSRRRSKHRRRA
ncbi:MAG: DUF4258 domain-containing protein [Chloroflexota bacterium]|nr:DUF4258 domain-containing protein [Chloroflexota bacterium]